jgi:parvulin-like peptidyl-prolyl isomerase
MKFSAAPSKTPQGLLMNKNSLLVLVVAAGILSSNQRTMAQDPSTQMVDPNRVVVVVNGEEIKGSEYYRRMEYLQGVGTRVGNSFLEFPPGFLTIQQLISERLTFGLAKEKGVYPSDEEVNAEIKLRLEDNPKMLDDWIAAGGNMEDLKYQLRVQIAQFKIQTFGITITDTEVEDHYKTKPDLFTTPKSLKLRIIAVASSDDTKVVDQDLAAGKDFAAEAKEKSIDITKNIGGEYGTVPEYNLSTETKTALEGVKIGQTTKWLTTAPSGGTGTYIKFLLEDIVSPKKLELTPSLKRTIRRSLMLDKGRVKNENTAKELDQMRLKAKIDIKQHEFAEAYQKYLSAYLKQRGLSQ